MKQITSFGEILFDVYPNYKKLGGAPFNFLYHIKKLTGKGNFISRVGNDPEGEEIIRFMKSNMISTDLIQKDNSHPTGSANANLDEQKIPHWEIALDCAYDFIEQKENLLKVIESSTDCLYFGSLVQRNYSSRQTLHSLFGMKKKYFCDLNIRQGFYTEKIIEDSLNISDLLKLNIEELNLLNNLFIRKKTDPLNLMKIISETFEIDLVCTTMGEEGALIYTGRASDFCNATAEEAADTVGAGDAYASILCIGYLEGWDISRINKTANEFAGEITGISGALPESNKLYEKYRDEIFKS